MIEITWFFLVRGLFVHYGAPEVPVNVVAAYHRLDGERSMHHESKTDEKFEIAERVFQGVWLEGPGKFENENFKILL